jgi:uncharacterized protein YigE (DUF2233 family)
MAAVAGYWLRANSRSPHIFAAADLPAPCREMRFEDVSYLVCEVDPRDVGIFHADPAGKAYGSLDAFNAAMSAQGRAPVLAMNAGMYHEGLPPVGLLVEGGREIAPLNLGDGEGNFFLKPNGVFSIAQDGSAAVTETGTYAAKGIRAREASQSGPMLVVDGQIHPKFEPNGESRHIRNGVGVRDEHTVLLAISLGEVSLGSFARLFRDGLGCPNALFFDGVISTFSTGGKTLLGGEYPVGPIIAVTERR